MSLWLRLQELEVAFARHPGTTEIVLDDKHRHSAVLWNDYRAQNAGLRVDEMIAFLADAPKPLVFKDAYLTLYETGLSFGMDHRQGKAHMLYANKLGTFEPPLALYVT